MPSLKSALNLTAGAAVMLFATGFSAEAQVGEVCGDWQYIQGSSERLLTDADIVDFGTHELRFARNEIYARHGYAFQSFDLDRWFSGCDWYHHPSNDVVLTDVEEANIDFIQAAEDLNALPLPEESYTARFVITDSDTLFPFIEGEHFMIYQDGKLVLELVGEFGEGGDHTMQIHDFGGGGPSVPLIGGGETIAEVAEFPMDLTYGTIFSASRYPFLLSPAAREAFRVSSKRVGETDLDGRPATLFEIATPYSEYSDEEISGSVWVSDHGITLKAEVEGRFAPEGQEDYRDFSIKYHLDEVKPRPIDAQYFEVPEMEEGAGFTAPG